MHMNAKMSLACGLVLLNLAPWCQAELKEFKDYAVACNNVLSCQAVSYLMHESEYDTSVHIKRSAEANSVVSIRLGSLMGEGFEANLVGQEITVTLGSTDFNLGQFNTAQQKTHLITIPTPQTDSFINAAKSANSGILKLGSKAFNFSLTGLTASLLYMDEKQKRLNTPTALVRKGNKPMTAKPPKLPQLTPVIAPNNTQVTTTKNQVLNLFKTGLADCDPQWVKTMEIYPLDAGHDIALIPCSVGAYNAETKAVKFTKKAPITAQEITLKDGESTSELINGEFFPSKGLLTSHYKGRGLGDCGVDESWVWTGQTFKLVSANVLDNCAGAYPLLNVWTTQLTKPIMK